ncbi:phosphatidylinositol N-acetylglucosaminyltransferase subunit P-like isoform X2 [Ostrea edulis]|uniref:phosphatidylinositol N-acetylglucosaminyltransferase subunit P-like isoform X2 n=1 Tax=Ostrea edulis TaxID=37623 RepID=UPI0020945062|nr:phosphatidylinositol N-acetylglucosaminyltransferase subunit P-like isoform X2 [Ostrea edulis]
MIAMTSRSTPSPVPDRATYGFVSYLLCYILFGIFLIWTYIPRTYLEGIGLTYWPSKFTAVSIPPFLCVLFLVYNILYEGLIFINTAPFQSLDTISDSEKEKFDYLPRDAINPIEDISIINVNMTLYRSY